MCATASVECAEILLQVSRDEVTLYSTLGAGKNRHDLTGDSMGTNGTSQVVWSGRRFLRYAMARQRLSPFSTFIVVSRVSVRFHFRFCCTMPSLNLSSFTSSLSSALSVASVFV